jgi:hypothetical protein
LKIHLGWTFGVAVLLAAGILASAPGRFTARQAGAVETTLVCDEELKQAIGATTHSNAPEVRAMRAEIRKAIALLRFHKPAEAQAQIDRAARRLERRPNFLTDGARSEWTRDFFKIADGALVAVDVRRLLAALPQDGASPVRLRVTGIDTGEFIHSNIIELRLE